MKSGRNDDPKAINRARQLRDESTLVEKVIWCRISKSQTGFRFRRQYPVGPYVLDFYCPEVRLDLEIDGPHHALRKEQDQARDRYMNELGIVVLRISANEAYDEPDAAVERIVAACKELKMSRGEGAP